MDWEVFNRLYSEEFSIDLLHAWRQVLFSIIIKFSDANGASFWRRRFQNPEDCYPKSENPGNNPSNVYVTFCDLQSRIYIRGSPTFLGNNTVIHCLHIGFLAGHFAIISLTFFQCGGFGVASAVYKEQLAILRTSDMSLIEYVEIVENVYTFL